MKNVKNKDTDSSNMIIKRQLVMIGDELSEHVNTYSQKRESVSHLYKKYKITEDEYRSRMMTLDRYDETIKSAWKEFQENQYYQTQQLKSLSQKADQAISKALSKLYELDKEKQNLDTRYEEIQDELTNFRSQFTETIASVNNLSSSKEQLEDFISGSERIEPDENLQSIKQQINEFSKGISSITKKTAKLQMKQQFYSTTSSKNSTQINDLDLRIQDLTSQIHESMNSSIQTRNSFRNSQTEQKTINFDELQLEKNKLVSSLEEGVQKYRQFSNDYKLLKSQITNLNIKLNKTRNDLSETAEAIKSLSKAAHEASEKFKSYYAVTLEKVCQMKLELSTMQTEKASCKSDLQREEENLKKNRKLLSENIENFPIYLDIIDKYYHEKQIELDYIQKYGDLKVAKNFEDIIQITDQIFEPDTSYKRIENDLKHESEQIITLRRQVLKLTQENSSMLKEIGVYSTDEMKKFELERMKGKNDEIGRNIEIAKIDIANHQSSISRLFIQMHNRAMSTLTKLANYEASNKENLFHQGDLHQWNEMLGIIETIPSIPSVMKKKKLKNKN
ncbi:hypothetical protein TVAG_056470 [Trichomonas vaginalis G3]|uniref:Uncharacterized protein n=1 Tax=Trichomonas vaginalis (strain ATCC PRA-98 / G3) TaxID=412133 RepID=A2ECK6_TRIV3|nr:hypothetical protein TVAGG3_0881940 [Trichomonas vaginalis G3]EAY09603.1 hypothetical protein TVAG_056470 [Trichomonas vaginalis G3]KAI5502115.1 hypothetical protein TVAGG3_0881940 [Trichomonas vaginalis G3]|eukprot:XP_001321826.1 hypothetical protein [Trichomonas vaginalis G3]